MGAPAAAETPAAARLDELLPLLARRLPEPFTPAAADRRLRALCRQLPLTALAALELRLGVPAPLDLSVRLGPAEARAVAAAARPRRLDPFLERWAGGGWPGVPWLWLEYDLAAATPPQAASDRSPPPPPSVIAALAPGAPDPLESRLFEALAGGPVPPPRRRALRRCLDVLPPRARPLYAFAMLSRPGQPARLEVGGLGFGELVAYLRRIAGAEAARRAATLEPLAAGAAPHHLAVDVADEVLPRFGIDCSFPRLPRREPRWQALLDRLVAADLCRGDERDALLAWSGHDTYRSAHQAWPPSAALGDSVARTVSHVKLVSAADQPPAAKAYLLLQLVPRRPV